MGRLLRLERILVVDDDVDFCQLVVGALRRAGLDAHAATGAVEALDLVASVDPHVVFLDLHMPGQHGHVLGPRLRQRSERDVQLVALTSDDRASAQAGSEEAGFAAHFVKPVRIEDLRRIARMLASRATALR